MLSSIVLKSTSAMHKWVHSFAMCVVLLHAIGGCCLHHDHAPCLDWSEDGDILSGYTLPDDMELCSSIQCPAECHEGECAFVVVGPRRVVKPVTDSIRPAVVGVQPHIVPLVRTTGPAREAPPPDCGPPLRLHLLNQVLLT